MDDDHAAALLPDETPTPATPPPPRQTRSTLFLLLVAILGVCTLIGYFHRFAICAAADSLTGIGVGSTDLTVAYYPYPWQQRQRDAMDFALNGDVHARTVRERYAPFIQKHPRERAFYAYYTLSVFHRGAYTPEMERCLQEGERLDPDNALYNYLRCAAMLQVAVHQQTVAGHTIVRTIRDRGLLDRAMQEVHRGARKPVFHAYHQEIMQAQCAAVPSRGNWEDQVNLIGVRAAILVPELAGMREIMRTLPWYSELLVKEGRQAEALAILPCWKPVTRHMTEETYTLIHLLVSGVMAKIARDTIPSVYNDLGRQDLALRTKHEANAIWTPVQVFKDAHKSLANDAYYNFIGRNAGAMPRESLSIWGPAARISAQELVPTRHVEYVLIEELVLSVLVPMFLVLMAYFSLVAFRWHLLVRRDGGTIRAMTLPLAQWLRIYGFGFGLPILLYTVLSRWTPLGGRQLGYMNHTPLFTTAWLLPTILILIVLPLYLARRAFRHQCIEEGMAMPSAKKESWLRFLGTVSATIITLNGTSTLGSLLLWIVFPRFIAAASGSLSPGAQSSALLVCGIIMLLLTLLLLLPIIWERFFRQYGPYFGSLARSLAVVCGISLLIVISILAPALNIEERMLVRRDNLLFYQPKQQFTSITPSEAQVVGSVRDAMLAVFAGSAK